MNKLYDLPSPTHTNASLEVYSGFWSFESAAHLLRRTTYGVAPEVIKESVSLGLEQTLDQLLEDKPLPNEPINFYYEADPNVPVGSSWIDQPFESSNNQLLGSRRRSLAAWTLGNLINSGMHIREKMTFFWNNHFVTQSSILQDPNLIYHNITMLREESLGNFRTLVEKVTISPGMLRYLNGNQNSAAAPNENYARELFELFTIGKGALAAPGDYTTFTEEDVFEAAKVLTGWRDVGYFMRDGNVPGSIFRSGRHDRSTKQLSHRFNHVTIENGGENEYKTLIGIILSQEEVAKYICRNLYRWFVYYDISDTVENQVIEPLADILRNNDYEIKPVLRALLSSQHFFEVVNMGPMIKNPLDFMVNLLTQFTVDFPSNDIAAYTIWSAFLRALESFEINYYEPPNVAGFKAYYQEPLYYRTWITAATLPVRQNYTNAMSSGNIRIGDFLLSIDILGYISRFNDPFDPNTLIDEFVANNFPRPITVNQRDFLKNILIPGLPDFEWTLEYGNHINDPNNEEIKRSVENKLRSFLAAFLNMPEYNLS